MMNINYEMDQIPLLNGNDLEIDQNAEIFKLPVELFEYIFILSYNCYAYWRFGFGKLMKTCKRLQKIAGKCFKKNYSGIMMTYNSGGIRCNGTEVGQFVSFIQKIAIGKDYFLIFCNNRSNYHQLKEIEIYHWNETHMYRFNNILLPQLEVLRVGNCEWGDNFNEIIDICTNLRHLEIECCTGNYDWLRGSYHSFEYVKLYPGIDQAINDIGYFFDSNAQIRKFATISGVLYENRFISSWSGWESNTLWCP